MKRSSTCTAAPKEYDHAAWSTQLAPFVGRFDRCLMVAHPYVDDAQFKMLRLFGNHLRAAEMQVLVNPNAVGYQTGEGAERFREKVWADLDAAYKAAVECVRELFAHRLISKLVTTSRQQKALPARSL